MVMFANVLMRLSMRGTEGKFELDRSRAFLHLLPDVGGMCQSVREGGFET